MLDPARTHIPWQTPSLRLELCNLVLLSRRADIACSASLVAHLKRGADRQGVTVRRQIRPAARHAERPGHCSHQGSLVSGDLQPDQ